MNFFAKISKFFKEVRLELKKVTWPSRQETINYTLMVIGISLGVAIFLGALDWVFTWLINTFLI